MTKIIGAGIYGCTLARLLADAGHDVVIVDQRQVVGGNCYSYYEDGIEVHKYGSHIFHTSDEDVWKFATRFAEFNNYQHHVIAIHNGKAYCMPFNLLMLNSFFGTQLTPATAKEFLRRKCIQIEDPKNLEQQAQTLIGDELYQAFIKNYTAKQWNKPLTNLSPDIIKRIPIRYDYNMSYFNDVHQGIPICGYHQMMKNMIDDSHIHLTLGHTYTIEELANDNNDDEADAIVYTGPVDGLCNYQFGILPWRSLSFETKRLDVNDFQGNSVINYVDADVKYTRIHEFKHYHPESKFSNTTIVQYEYPTDWNIGLERYYPIASVQSSETYSKYVEYLSSFKKLRFGGRLGRYEYADMDDSMLNAMKMAKTLED